MKIKCNDNVIREFCISKNKTTMTRGGPVETGGINEAYCMECGEEFGCHDTYILKPIFRKHICQLESPTHTPGTPGEG